MINYSNNICQSHLSIYDHIEIGDPNLWIPTSVLEELLTSKLFGISLSGLPLRTRSKFVKEKVCQALGYPVPSSFKRTRPRFSGQQLDIYVQKANNLQIWNEELVPTRRYAIIRITKDEKIEQIRVITGEDLALYDKTGTLTQKYQARLVLGNSNAELVSQSDTALIASLSNQNANQEIAIAKPTDDPSNKSLLPIKTIYERLQSLIGVSFIDIGYDQERNRGAELHKLICECLGYHDYADNGRFPDIRHQLLEVKLQTSATIDLGLVKPSSYELLDVPMINGYQIKHSDVRYALFHAVINKSNVFLTHLFLTTGEDFFQRFPQFGGKVLNKKLQIPLPREFFQG